VSEDVIEVFLVLGAIAIALLVALWLSRRNKRRKAPAKSRHRYIQDSAVAYLAGADSGLASQPHPAPAPDSSPGFVGGGGESGGAGASGSWDAPAGDSSSADFSNVDSGSSSSSDSGGGS
jgi:uncharacterized membrane protein YgcG